MRRGGIASCLAALGAAACSADTPSTVRVELDLLTTPCAEEQACSRRHSTRGVLAVAGEPEVDDLARQEGDVLLHADFDLDAARVGLLEMAIPAVGPVRLRWVELERGAVAFEGEVTSRDVRLRRIGDTTLLDGTFAFTVEGEAAARDVKNGVIAPVVEEPDVARGSSGTVVVVGRVDPPPRTVPSVPDPEPSPWPSPDPIPDPDPAPDPDPDPGWEPEPSFPDDGGCDGDTVDPEPVSDAGGCESSSTSSGGGCEGDSASSSGGCDGGGSSGCSGCEGDVAARPKTAGRAASGVFRLAWPVLLVGFVNRRVRRRLGR